MAVTKRLRYEILRRDNHTCRYCGDSAPHVKLTVDHVVPVALGGADVASNLVAACASCNSGKTSTNPDAPLVDDVATDALRWSAAMQQAAEWQRARETHMNVAIESLGEWWEQTWLTDEVYAIVVEGSWHWPSAPDREYAWGVEIDNRVVQLFDSENDAYAYAEARHDRAVPPRPDDWRSSARTWLQAGITNHDCVPLMEMVQRERDHVAWDLKWKYFAGCAWNVLRERQDIARDMLAAGDTEAF